jgi:hypothetical protein
MVYCIENCGSDADAEKVAKLRYETQAPIGLVDEHTLIECEAIKEE